MAILKGDMKIEALDAPTLRKLFKEILAQTVLKPDGTFRFDNIEAGTHTLLAWIPAPAGQPMRFTSTIIQVKGETKVDLTIP